MNTDWNPNEEYHMLPEYTETYEYTPEYPDVTFFKESSVTAREENISQGEAPAGEDSFAVRREKRRKRVREYWLRNLLGAAVRGGVILMATAGLVVTLATGHEQEPSSPAGRISEQVAVLKKPALSQPHDYGPRQLASLWRGEPQAPHQYDMDHPITVRDGSCTEDGLIEYYCTECHAALKYSISGGHRAQAAERENEKAPTCLNDGRYDEVVYCAVCHEELSRATTVLPATGHKPEEAVAENEKAATCTENGSYDSVVYCSVCHEEISREAITLESPGHLEDHPVQENLVKASCTEEGSYDKVIYCSVCHEELSREAVTLPLARHDPGLPEEGESKEPTCTEDGFYEEITVCRNCGKELLRETITLAATGHTAGEPEEENLVEATCREEGGYDTVTVCTVCGEEISREHTVLEKTDHVPAEAVRENEVEATCTADGSYDEVIYCSECHTELSRSPHTVAALGHNYTASVTAASCTAQGYTTHTCSRCQDSYTDTYTAALGHSYAASAVAATCTAQGYTAHTCSRCGDTYRDTYTQALGHNYTSSITEPSCTAQGYTTHTCSRCGNNYRDGYTDALGHNFVVDFYASDYDYDNPVKYCTRCHSVPAMTLSYNASNRTFTYTLNSDFRNTLIAGGYYGWFSVQYAGTGYAPDDLSSGENNYWTADPSETAFTPISGTLQANTETFEYFSGQTVQCQLCFYYSEGSGEGDIRSPIITITIP